jgi:FKBP-type peptidyl-prolyl cis-trans isomerase
MQREQGLRGLRVFKAGWLVVVGVLAACAAHRGPFVTPSGLSYEVVARGRGPSARPGDHVTIHETTSFADGRVHFTTDGRKPIRFLLGGKQVIDGLDEGVTCMKVGERRRLVVPPVLSRRSAYPPDLDPTAVLYYDVTVVKIEKS